MREGRIHNTFAMCLLEAMAEPCTLTLHDWKSLLCMVLTLTQFMMWLSDFCELRVVALIENLNWGIAVNYEQLAGENSCADSVTQARYPWGNYLQMKEMAIKAVRMQEAGPASSESSATVLQGPRESCTNFIDRLQNILQQVEHQEVWITG